MDGAQATTSGSSGKEGFCETIEETTNTGRGTLNGPPINLEEDNNNKNGMELQMTTTRWITFLKSPPWSNAQCETTSLALL